VVARWVTVIVCVPAAVPFAAVALTTSLFEELTDNPPKSPVKSVRAWRLVWKAVMSLWRLCNEEVTALSAVTRASNVFSGAASISRIASTVEVTSMPLPEVLVAEFRMASTASRIAAFSLEVEEVEEELVSPRSWLSDSLELPTKLDRSELMELVLIPLLLLRLGSARFDPWSSDQLSYRQIGNFLEPKEGWPPP
jgi:hypothetical protein